MITCIVEKTYPYIDAIKIGYPIVLGLGLSVARDLAEFDFPLIGDFKVADIPNTNRLIDEHVFEAGFSSYRHCFVLFSPQVHTTPVGHAGGMFLS